MLAHRPVHCGLAAIFALGSVACDPQQLSTSQLVAETDGVIRDVALSDTHVYWTNAGSSDVVQRAARSDGASIEALASGDGSPFALTLDETSVLFSSSGGTEGNRILRISQSGGAASAVVSPTDAVSHLVTDGDVLFYATTGGDVYQLSSDGSPLSLSSDQGSIGGLSYNESEVFWTDQQAGTLMSVTRNGGPIQVVADGLDAPRGLVVEKENAYLTAGTTGEGVGGQIIRVNIADGSATSLVDGTSIGGDADIAVSEGKLYWFQVEGSTTDIMTVPVDGGTAQRVVESEAGATGLVVKGQELYWATTVGPKGQILRASL